MTWGLLRPLSRVQQRNLRRRHQNRPANAFFIKIKPGTPYPTTIQEFDPTWPQERFGDDPHALDHLMDGLRFQTSDDDVLDDPVEAPESVSSALALIGRVTETDIATDWFLAQHSRIRPTS